MPERDSRSGQSDHGMEYSLAYFSALTESLHISYEMDRPVFVPAEVNRFSFQLLGEHLQDLFDSRLRMSAVDLNVYPGDTRPILTTGVGFAREFDLFVKLGFLLGDRLVLWDSVILGCLSRGYSEENAETLGVVACELLRLRPIVEAGGLVLLPHPRTWLERAAYYFRAGQGFRGNTAALGYVNARALVDEGFEVHPYSLESDAQVASLARRLVYGSDEALNSQREATHTAMLDVLRYQNLGLMDANAVDFFKKFRVSGQLGPRDHLRAMLAENRTDLSPAERAQYRERLLHTIDAGVQEYDRAIREDVENRRRRLQARTAIAGVIAAFIGVVTDYASAAGVFPLIAGGLELYNEIGPLLEPHARNDGPVTLYQVFSELRQSAAEERQADTLIATRGGLTPLAAGEA